MTDDTPMDLTLEERARVEVRHAVEALAKVLNRSSGTAWTELGMGAKTTLYEQAAHALAFARARVPIRSESCVILYAEGWNACRAAMLARLGGEDESHADSA